VLTDYRDKHFSDESKIEILKPLEDVPPKG